MLVTKPAPDFTAPCAFPEELLQNAVRNVTLSDYKNRWLVFFWYPLDFTFVCPTEILAISDRIEEFQEIDCDVLAASTDSVYSHRAWMRTSRNENGIEGIRIPILSDKSGKIAKKYEIMLDNEGYSLRGLFLIDPKGIIVHTTINANTVGRNVDELLRVIQAFQSGGLCASGWKPGDSNLHPS
jgi:peroxiredoxin 2/4